MIAVTLANPRHLKRANSTKADLIEIRTDLYPESNIAGLIAKCEKPVILTIKSPRTVWLDYIDSPKVKYVDIDYRLTGLIKEFHKERSKRVKLIVSFHDYKETPSWERIQKRLVQLQKLNPDVIKVATMIEEFDDISVIARLQKKLGKKVIAVGMGDLGMMTRIYNRGLLTYARLSATDKQTLENVSAAPGQLTVEQLKERKIFGLVGDAIKYSLSPLMYNNSFQHYDLPHIYQLWDTSKFSTFKEVFNFFKLPGASVTQPFKTNALKMVDHADADSVKIGAVNTVVRDSDDKLIGYNTDWVGAEKALHGELKDKKILILGAGGASAAVAYAAEKNGATKVTVLSRRDMPTDEDDFDVLVNATPVYDTVLVPEDSLYSKVVMDCNYGTITELVRHAEKKARVVMDGLPMLLYQGEPQFKYWTGKKMPVEKIMTALKKHKKAKTGYGR